MSVVRKCDTRSMKVHSIKRTVLLVHDTNQRINAVIKQTVLVEFTIQRNNVTSLPALTSDRAQTMKYNDSLLCAVSTVERTFLTPISAQRRPTDAEGCPGEKYNW